MLGKLLGCAGLFMVLTGLGIHLGLATTLLIYTLTIMAALVGPLPGGIGVADASLGALLIANGVAGPTAAAAVLAFRLLDLWLPLFVGAAAGARQYRRNRAAGRPGRARAPAPGRRATATGRSRHGLTAGDAASGRVDDRVRSPQRARATSTSPASPRWAYAHFSYVEGESSRPPAMTYFTWSPWAAPTPSRSPAPVVTAPNASWSQDTSDPVSAAPTTPPSSASDATTPCATPWTAIDDRHEHRDRGEAHERPGGDAMGLADPVRGGRVAEPQPRAGRDQRRRRAARSRRRGPDGRRRAGRRATPDQPTGVSASSAPSRISVGVSEPRSSSICFASRK